MLLTAVWFASYLQTADCHSDNALCEHSGSSKTVADCDCHPSFEPLSVFPVQFHCRLTMRFYPPKETPYNLLLPDDIFRPPLTKS